MIAKVVIGPLVVAGGHGAVLRLPEMDVAEVDEVPVLVVALVVMDVAVGLVGDVALLPRRLLRFHRL